MSWERVSGSKYPTLTTRLQWNHQMSVMWMNAELTIGIRKVWFCFWIPFSKMSAFSKNIFKCRFIQRCQKRTVSRQELRKRLQKRRTQAVHVLLENPIIGKLFEYIFYLRHQIPRNTEKDCIRKRQNFYINCSWLIS